MEEPGLKLTSPAFNDGEGIGIKYTCDGEDINPPLKIEGVPPETKSLVLIVDDPDAPIGTWVHWLLWNINPATSEIAEGEVPSGAVQGVNDFRKNFYGGPCPPSGTHCYFFKLYALDTTLDLSENSGKSDLLKEMEGHVLAKTQLVGSYSRK